MSACNPTRGEHRFPAQSLAWCSNRVPGIALGAESVIVRHDPYNRERGFCLPEASLELSGGVRAPRIRNFLAG
jgi:hypothetical protein